MDLGSYEAENNFIVLQLSRRSILQGFIFITQILLKVIKGHGPLQVEGGGSCFKIPSRDIL